jgi:glycosyltransferase involved in cell wall biosynthesis
VNHQKRIWFAAAVMQNSHGGVARNMQTNADLLQAHGWTSTIIYADTPGSCRNYLLFMVLLALKLLCTPPNQRPLYLCARSTDGLLCALLYRVGVVKTRVVLHNHGWEEKVLQLENRLAPSVITNPTTWRGRLIRIPLLNLTLRTASVCICGTTHEIDFLTHRYPAQGKKIHLLPNMISSDPSRTWCDISDFAPHFITVGGQTWKKNLEYTLQVFSHIYSYQPKSMLHIVGATSHSSPPPGTVWHNHLNWSGVDQLFRQTPYFLLSSRFEGGRSLALLEALSHGCLVLVSPIDTFAEVIQHGSNGLVGTGNSADSDALLLTRLMEEPLEQKTIRTAAAQSAANYTPQQIAPYWQRILHG